jgi:MSHA pilin protein MshD
MPFTYCDPDDANAATAGSSAGCAVGANSEDAAMGPEGGETRYNASAPFDNVSDYHGLNMSGGIKDITNTTIGGLGAYSASITVTQAGTAAPFSLADNTEVLKISIVVSGPGGVSTTLEGYRARYAPNTLP